MSSAFRVLANDFNRIQLEGNGFIGVLIAILLVALVVNLAARIVVDKSSFLAAIGTTVIGFVLLFAIQVLLHGTLGTVLGLAAWALVAASFYRTNWLKGAVIGLVAAVLFVLLNWLLAKLFG